MEQEFQSSLLENAVRELSKLPGIGRKTALRLALNLLRKEEGVAVALGQSLINLRTGITYCKECHNISESEFCPICSNSLRDHKVVCVVENVKDVMSFENTRQFNGVYHVLGGLISPLDGIGPDSLEIASLEKRVLEENVSEVILALSATMEGDTTNFFIFRKLSAVAPSLKITQIARGVAVGNEIEYTDELTLGRSLLNRTLFDNHYNING